MRVDMHTLRFSRALLILLLHVIMLNKAWKFHIFAIFNRPLSYNICTRLRHATCRVVHGGERHVTQALTMKDETLT